MFEKNSDLQYGFYAIIGGLYAAFSISSLLAFVVFMGIAIYFCVSGIIMLSAENTISSSRSSSSYGNRRGETREQIRPTSSAPISAEPTIAEKIKNILQASDFKCPSCGAVVKPTDTKCRHCDSFLVASADLPSPAKWGDVEAGQSIRVLHPQKGQIDTTVAYRIYYGELWQERMTPDTPWTLTGNYYVGLGLGNNMFLMNWQSRFYLLDSRSPITDMDINRDFAPHARKFAASNQTEIVFFEYKANTWRMDDIGRFRVEYCDGDNVKVSAGAVGRFIHAGANNLALVVEDYQSGGKGIDTLWQGYKINEKDIQL